ncbi:MAG: biosynthetic peptidoglycan transglycosylase [Nitrososphaerales archaeon]
MLSLTARSNSVTELITQASDRFAASPIRLLANHYASALNAPAHFVEMLFLIEDKRFPFHLGVDPIAICRAIVFNRRGCALQGASTLVQQLYNIHQNDLRCCHRNRTYGRKLRQSLWAIYMAAHRSKTALLMEYVEHVYWGGSINGLDQAAKTYFGKLRRDLSPAQSFFLAERIAMPNRCSVRRVGNLLLRPAIQSVLRRYQACIEDVISIYEDSFGAGGELWRFQAK